MIRQNLHTHTSFDDGINTVAEMAQAAVDAGLTSLGFSGHSPLPYANEWSMTPEGETAYRAAVAEAKTAFAGQLEILCGLEWDMLSPPPKGYDYVIGSIHHLTPPSATPPPSADESPEASLRAVEWYYGGDPAAMAEAYYSQYETMAKKSFVDIVGHFDLLTKFDEKAHIFDPDDPRYIDAAMAALELLLRADKIFEVNTGAMSRGWRTTPYPSRYFLRELRTRKARVLVASDSHSAAAVAHAFPETEALLREIGFAERWELTETGFAPVRL